MSYDPDYTIDSADLRGFRSDAKDAGGAMKLLPCVREAYGDAVERAIRAKQRSELKGAGTKARRCNCASGTDHSDGADIHKAVRAQQAAALAAYPAKVRRARTSWEWETMYQAAMAEKRKAAELAQPSAEIVPLRREAAKALTFGLRYGAVTKGEAI